MFVENAPLHEASQGVVQGHVAAADRRGARTPISLQDVAVHGDRYLGHELQARHRAQANVR